MNSNQKIEEAACDYAALYKDEGMMEARLGGFVAGATYGQVKIDDIIDKLLYMHLKSLDVQDANTLAIVLNEIIEKYK